MLAGRGFLLLRNAFVLKDPKSLINPMITNEMPHLSVGRIQVLVPLVLFLRTQYGFVFEDNAPNCQQFVSGNHLLPH